MGRSQSCGCLKLERTSAAKTTHGESVHNNGNGSIEYQTWLRMKSRCTHKSVDMYYLYGGRGITFCKRWLKYENFLLDMGRRPSSEHSLERKDTNGNYEPPNCIWATRIEQANNKRNNRPITFNGVTMNMFQWARKMGMRPGRLHARLESGWSVERALTEPVRKLPSRSYG